MTHGPGGRIRGRFGPMLPPEGQRSGEKEKKAVTKSGFRRLNDECEEKHPNEHTGRNQDMKTLMTIAAGAAIGYFIYQYFMSTNGRTTHGRIHRSVRDRKICGVCGGIAEWLGIDPAIVRIVWAVMVMGWGTGALLYLICVFVLPEE